MSSENVNDVLQGLDELKDESLEGAILSSYQIHCEWVTPSGDVCLSNYCSDNLAPWQQMGYAMNSVASLIADRVVDILMHRSEEYEE